MCGMTTTFALMADLQLLGGLTNQPMGAVLFALTVGSVIMGLLDLVFARGLWRLLLDFVVKHDVAVALGIVGGMVSGWIYKIVLFF